MPFTQWYLFCGANLSEWSASGFKNNQRINYRTLFQFVDNSFEKYTFLKFIYLIYSLILYANKKIRV